VVHGAGGIDELSPIGPSLVCEVVDGSVHERTIDPEELGVERCSLEALAGGAPAENAAAVRRIFAGERGGPREAILLNAAAAITVLFDDRFAGSLDGLRAARAATAAPLLGKGFFATEGHLRELRDAGADAVLLILRDLDDGACAHLLAYSRELGMDALVEA